MAKLTDIQTLLLTTAASRADGDLLPPPAELNGVAVKVRRAITALIKQELVREEGGAEGGSVWREEDGERYAAVITDAGREAIGAPLPPVVPAPVVAGSKTDAVLALLRRGQGATIAELTSATGWLPHTTRAALTGLRKKGHGIIRDKRGEATCYRIAAAA